MRIKIFRRHYNEYVHCTLINLKTIQIVSILFSIMFLSCKTNSVSPESGENTLEFIGLKNETITAIGLDPTNENVIYAGSRYNFSYGTPGRLFKSTDGGKTWDTLIVNYGALFMEIIVDPKNTAVIYAAPWGVIKSSDGG
ncbi:MAG: hypothetical protein P4L45_13395, partial [Ignavibacteriaceae bacterium]|nr:hypothetical protein [Ignavibacteriaceae bacterium]